MDDGTAAQRWLARTAFAVAAAAAVAVLLAAGGLRGLALVLLGATGVALCLVALWWFALDG